MSQLNAKPGEACLHIHSHYQAAIRNAEPHVLLVLQTRSYFALL